MDDNESLRTIAAELRQLARAGYGFPPAVRVKVETLLNCADRLEQIADATLTSTVRHDVEKTEDGASSYCKFCDLEHQLHEDTQGFHHVINGERVPCCSVTSTDRSGAK